MTNNELNVSTLETRLWDAACRIRGEIDAPKSKEYILPLIFLKRLSDVFDDELTKLSEDYLGRAMAERGECRGLPERLRQSSRRYQESG